MRNGESEELFPSRPCARACSAALTVASTGSRKFSIFFALYGGGVDASDRQQYRANGLETATANYGGPSPRKGDPVSSFL